MFAYFKSSICCLLLFTAFCSGLAAKVKPPITIAIDSVTLSYSHPRDTIDIVLTTEGRQVGGVDLKFGYDANIFKLLTVLQGDIPDSCGWNVFNSREAIESGQENFPRKMWQILAMAEFGPDTLRPDCHGFDRPASLARLVIALDSAQLRNQPGDSGFSIYFFWEDCSDNTVTDVSGDQLYISAEVDSLSSTDLAVMGALFPNRLGAPSQCVKRSAKNPPQRKVGFYSGKVTVRTVVENQKTNE